MFYLLSFVLCAFLCHALFGQGHRLFKMILLYSVDIYQKKHFHYLQSTGIEFYLINFIC